MSAVMTAPGATAPVERKCKIEDVFDPSFIELIGLAPGNPHVRALILKLAGKMPGPECGTLAQIQDWVETNCEQKARPSPNRATRGAADDGISIRVQFSETESGRASYSVRRSGSDEFHLGAEDLLEIARAALDDGDGLDEIVDRVAAKVDEDAWDDCDPEMDDYGDYDYSDHDSDDINDSETNCSRTEIRDRVLAFLRERHPELAGEL